MLVITIIYSFLYHYAPDKRFYLEQLEYAPLLAASVCFSLLCSLPGTPSPFPCVKTPIVSPPVPPAVSLVPGETFLIPPLGLYSSHGILISSFV